MPILLFFFFSFQLTYFSAWYWNSMCLKCVRQITCTITHSLTPKYAQTHLPLPFDVYLSFFRHSYILIKQFRVKIINFCLCRLSSCIWSALSLPLSLSFFFFTLFSLAIQWKMVSISVCSAHTIGSQRNWHKWRKAGNGGEWRSKHFAYEDIRSKHRYILDFYANVMHAKLFWLSFTRYMCACAYYVSPWWL